MFSFVSKFFDYNSRVLKSLEPQVAAINSLEKKVALFNDKELKSTKTIFSQKLAAGSSLQVLLPEIFARVREASKRVVGLRHFDVQLMAGIILHEGKIAEQKTGEGKTLTATLPLFLDSLTGKGVHLVTVNDYLARRDCGWMGPIYYALGASCSAIINDAQFIYDPEFVDPNQSDERLCHLRPIERRQAYEADIIYGINSEFSFDYLRDNMASNKEELVQRDLYFAIVDEVDSVLIDEARTPHIISAPGGVSPAKYKEYAVIAEKLVKGLDYVSDEKLKTISLNDHGVGKIEKLLKVDNVYEKDFSSLHHIEASLKAKEFFKKEKDYIVKNKQIVIVDEFTGRLLEGRRFSEGIHQAIEAKENVEVQEESKTLATISLQNYFRMYEKLAGMTGTAVTEAEEFKKIYNLETIVIPTHKTCVRKDLPDMVYKTKKAKYTAVANAAENCFKNGQPVLIGTTSIDNNEAISELLKRKKIPHNVLNAKNHQKEAEIIANAGKSGMVTVATNMAGRGVDISLDDKARQAGGLMVIGTERHESRRIDNQLRGRSGRQGDPGKTQFFVSLEDDMLRIFGGDQVANLMNLFKMPENVPLSHPMVSRAIEQSQIKVEGFNFDARKHLVEYDDILNKQRLIVYRLRKKVLTGSFDSKKYIKEKIASEIDKMLVAYSPEGFTDKEIKQILLDFSGIIPFDEDSQQELERALKDNNNASLAKDLFIKVTDQAYTSREKTLGEELMREIERFVILQTIDALWMEHLEAIDNLREGIDLRRYAQKDPLVEYKGEAFRMFENLMNNIDFEVVHRIYKIDVSTETLPPLPQVQINAEAGKSQSNETPGKKNLGRNDPCWCGSGKKYKKCHWPN